MSRNSAKSRGAPGRRAAKPARAPVPDVSALLMAEGLADDDVRALLAPYGLRDVRRADRSLQAMAGEPRSRALLASLLGELLEAVSETADPDQALTAWERFVEAGLSRTQLFGYLGGSPRLVALLSTVFGNSPAMTQTLIRDPILVYWLAEEHVLSRRPSRPVLAGSLAAMLANLTTEELRLESLRRFKRREMLRIGIRDLLGRADVRETMTVLSDLATILIQSALAVVETELIRRYGVPRHRDARGRSVPTGFGVIAMGKLGGGELNFSSDVDLIFVSESDDGTTTGSPANGQAGIPNEEFFEDLARGLTKALGEVTPEGYVFRVDLRLRAEGAVGRLCRSLEDYRRYYGSRGQHWERMALLKAWPVAGSATVGRAFVRMARSFIQGPGTGDARRDGRETLLEEIKAIKTMIDGKMTERGLERRHVKLGIGGIREVEFLVQAVQLLCSRSRPDLLVRSTLGALERFRRHRLLSARDHQALAASYLFLRDVEHKLQMVHDLQTHALPAYDEEVAACAIRLGYHRGRRRAEARQRFLDDYARHTGRVHRWFEDLLGDPAGSRLLTAVRGRGAPRR